MGQWGCPGPAAVVGYLLAGEQLAKTPLGCIKIVFIWVVRPARWHLTTVKSAGLLEHRSAWRGSDHPPVPTVARCGLLCRAGRVTLVIVCWRGVRRDLQQVTHIKNQSESAG